MVWGLNAAVLLTGKVSSESGTNHLRIPSAHAPIHPPSATSGPTPYTRCCCVALAGCPLRHTTAMQSPKEAKIALVGWISATSAVDPDTPIASMPNSAVFFGGGVTVGGAAAVVAGCC